MTQKSIYWDTTQIIIDAAWKTYHGVDLSKNQAAFISLLSQNLIQCGQETWEKYNVIIAASDDSSKRVATIDLLVAKKVAVWVLKQTSWPTEYQIVEFRRIIRAASLNLGFLILVKPHGIQAKRIHPAPPYSQEKA